MLETLNFTRKEMQCPCCEACDMESEFMLWLQVLREEFGRAMPISSGFRCSLHNETIGGSINSQHMCGLAADIFTANFQSKDLHYFLKLAFQLGFRGIGIGRDFVHLDTRSGRAKMWIY